MVGLVGLRAQVKDEVSGNVRQMLVDAVHDELGHAYAVASGLHHFRGAFQRGMGCFFDGNRAQADNLADVCFQFLETQWRKRHPGVSAVAFLDAVHVPSPESAAEVEKAIEDAWEVSIASSDASMERHYVGGARVRKGADAFRSCWHRTPEEILKADKKRR